MFEERKASFKALPATMRDPVSSQEVRRKKALEDQRRRRAERIDSTRQLDLFADLNLGISDDERDEDDTNAAQSGLNIAREGISAFATLLPPSHILHAQASESAVNEQENNMQNNGKKKGKKRKAKARAVKQQQASGTVNKPNKWGDKCMYAELLEMTDNFGSIKDGIPNDIETGWVAVTPVPVGKRCLVVTHQTPGIVGVVPNTTVRSRVLGKPLIKPFPSPLPPRTILDCVLDTNWRHNGIIHVLDVIKWKGQDVGECETAFRFWWRDTRLSELKPSPPPLSSSDHLLPSGLPDLQYNFPHPTLFVPIPYHTNLTLQALATSLIPLTRLSTSIPVSLPASAIADSGTMELDSGSPAPLVQLQSVPMLIEPDGLLLYVAQATYEPGTSPLSSWVPIRAYTTDPHGLQTDTLPASNPPAEGPLDLFERLVKRRLANSGVVRDVAMDE